MARSLVATEAGVKRAREALIDRGMSQTILEKRLGFSRATVSKFFNGKPLDHQYFTSICNELKLEWRDITGKVEEEPMKGIELTKNCEQVNIDTISIAMSAKNKARRNYTDTNPTEGKSFLSFAIAGTIDQVDQKILDVIVELLRQKTNDISIAIVDIQEGSIKLILTGTAEALKMIQSLYRSGEITEVEGIPIENVELLVDKSEVARNQNINDIRSDLSEQFGNHPRMKVVEFNAGEKFFLMLVPNGSVEEAWNALDQGNTQDMKPLFSLVTASPTEAIQTGQIIDITGDGSNYIFEDIRQYKSSKRDFSDLIFQVKGATITTMALDELIVEGENDYIFDDTDNINDGLIYGGSDEDSISGGEDNDLIFSYANDYLICGDIIYGDSGDNLFCGYNGNDSISGGKDNDSIFSYANDCLDGTYWQEIDWRNANLDKEIIKYRNPKRVKNGTPMERTILNLLKFMNQLGLLDTKSHSIVNRSVSKLFFRPSKRQKSPSVVPIDFSESMEDSEPIAETPIPEPILEKNEFTKEDQPLVGFIDTHITTGNSDINYSNITFDKDCIENDRDPAVIGEDGIHGDHLLGVVAATQNNGIGIDNINDVDDSEQALKSIEDSIESESDLFSQVIAGYYTVEATGNVEFQIINNDSNYRGQLAVISMTGMENLDINSREFFQEALDRAMFGSEAKLGYIINADID